MEYLPDAYPHDSSQMKSVDVTARAKILKAHLEDVFRTEKFSVSVRRRKTAHVMSITCENANTEQILSIARLYADCKTRLVLEKF